MIRCDTRVFEIALLFSVPLSVVCCVLCLTGCKRGISQASPEINVQDDT